MKIKYVILVIAMLLLSSGFYFVFDGMIVEKKQEIKKLDKKIKSSRQDLNSLIVQSEKLGEFTNILKHSITKEKSFSSDEIHEMLFSMDEIAQGLGIDISGINHKDLFTKAKQVEHEFDFVFNTTYVKLGRFINQLEKMDYLTVIKTFEIEPYKKGEKSRKKVGDKAKLDNLEKIYTVNLNISFIKHVMR